MEAFQKIKNYRLSSSEYEKNTLFQAFGIFYIQIRVVFASLFMKFLPIFLIFNSLILFSQPEAIQFRLHGFEEGLTHRNVSKIQQDALGYIWIATFNGLNRYDGHRIIHYNSHHSENWNLPNDNISDILIDHENKIWLAVGNDLVLMDPATGQLQIVPVSEDSELHNQTRSLYNLFKDKNGFLYTASAIGRTATTILQKTDGQSPLKDLQKAPGKYLKRPIIQWNENIFVGYFENELWEFNHKGEKINQYDFSFPDNKPSFSRITQLQVTANNTLWVLLDNGQVYFKKENVATFEKHPITNSIYNLSSTTSFLVEEEGDIWVGGMNQLWQYDEGTGKVHDYHEQVADFFQHSATFRQIFKDRTGVIWIATDFGALTLSRSDHLFTNYLNGGNDYCNDGFCSTRGITEDEEGNIYFTYYHSIHVLDPKSERIRPLFPRTRHFNLPYSILYKDDALWTGEGLRIDLQTLSVDTIIQNKGGEESVNMIDKDGLIWFGCGNKLCYFDNQSQVLSPFIDSTGMVDTLDIKNITHLYQGKKNDFIWIGTRENGLFKISKTEGGLAHYHSESTSVPQLSHSRILAVQEDNIGNLWIATASGVNKLEIETEKLSFYNSENGLPNNFINGLLVESDSVIWISTDVGLSRMNTITELFRNFSEEDGLSKNEFNRMSFYKASDGRMYFGGLDGVNAFYPGTKFIKERRKTEGRILFTSFSEYNEKLDSLTVRNAGLRSDEKINLPWSTAFFTLSFSLADYANPRTHLFSYKLDGYDNDWSEPLDVNSMRYNNIPAGNYTFRVRANAGNGLWVKDELAVKINIEQAFFRTTWFQISALLLLALAGFLLFQYRVYRIKKKEQELEALVKERTKELEEEKQKSEDLLLNILPPETAEELKQYGSAKARRYESVTVLFSDFKAFVKIAEKMEPEDLVAEIDHCFRAYDHIMEKYGLEKIKTIGDAYLCVGNIPNTDKKAAIQVVKAALEIQEFMFQLAKDRNKDGLPFFEARIGIHTGAVVAGIVGIKKFAYDIWGDTVNIAARMESNSEIGKVNVSETTYQLIKNDFHCTYRGKLTAKHKGEVDMYFVESYRENGKENLRD